MTTNDGTPTHDGADLAELRKTIDELQEIPADELVDPVPHNIEENVPTPEITDAIGSEKWDRPADEETTAV